MWIKFSIICMVILCIKWYNYNMELMSNNHSVFILHYHLILVVKYRRKVITDEISRKLGIEFEKVCENYNIRLEDWNHDIDHVHILFNANPNTNISKFINAYKSASSRIIKKEFPEIKQQLWKQNFWNTSFCLISTGGATIEVIKKYIESQGE